jgi:peroxiredoxin
MLVLARPLKHTHIRLSKAPPTRLLAHRHHACASLPHTQGKKVMMVGFPGGPVCMQKQIPAYIAMVGEAVCAC